jgi:RAB protein geranylgeranyltransferase component A
VLAAVPASRAEIFQDRSLSLPDKRFLMRFFKLVTDYAESPNGTVAELSASDLERPFVEILQRQNLPPYIREYVYYLQNAYLICSGCQEPQLLHSM